MAKGPHAPFTVHQPLRVPAALHPLPFNLSGPHALFAVHQPLRVPCSSASPPLQPEWSRVLLCSKNEAAVPACRFKLSLKKHGRFCLLSGNPATTRTSRPGQPAGRVRGPQGEGSVQHPGGRPQANQPAICMWVSKSSQAHPGLMNQPS